MYALTVPLQATWYGILLNNLTWQDCHSNLTPRFDKPARFVLTGVDNAS